VRPPLREVEWVKAVLALVQTQPAEGWIEPRYFRVSIPDVFRSEFLGQLESLVDYRAGDRRLFARELEGGLLRFPGLTCEPYLLLQGGRIRRRYRIRGGGAKAILDYTLALLLDDDLGMIGRLARCLSCGKFFLKGPKQRRYCTNECTQRANRAGNAQRVAASRAGMPVAEYRAKRVKRGRRK
jgi:hypothetical protein